MGTALAESAADITAPSDLEYKAAGATGVLLTSDDEKGIVEALVSVTGIVDEQGDIIEPGAYADTLARRKSKGVRFHDWTRMAAKTLVQDEWLPATLPNGEPWPKTAGALYIKGQYNLEIKDGQEGYSNAKFYADEGQWSIGYKPAEGTAYRRKSDGARVLPKVDLYEWSDVLHGAAPQTSTLGVKAAGIDAGGGVGQGIEEKVRPGAASRRRREVDRGRRHRRSGAYGRGLGGSEAGPGVVAACPRRQPGCRPEGGRRQGWGRNRLGWREEEAGGGRRGEQGTRR
jgi:hypothetical protein